MNRYTDKICEFCGRSYTPTSGNQRVCADSDCKKWRKNLSVRPYTTDTGSVYALIDPRSFQVRYVGVTTAKIDDRLKFHIGEHPRRLTHKVNWIAKLRRLGLQPMIVLLESMDVSNGTNALFAREVEWIAFMRSLECNLVNGNDGGRGGQRGPHGASRSSPSDEAKRKIAESVKALWQDPEYVAMQMNSRGKRRGIAPPNKGVTPSDETRRKISETLKDRWQNEEFAAQQRQLAQDRRPTHCKHGHEFTEENTRIDAKTGNRVCRICAHDRYVERRDAAA